MNQFVLALDQGTTSSRAIVFDHSRPSSCLSSEGILSDLSQTGLGGT